MPPLCQQGQPRRVHPPTAGSEQLHLCRCVEACSSQMHPCTRAMCALMRVQRWLSPYARVYRARPPYSAPRVHRAAPVSPAPCISRGFVPGEGRGAFPRDCFSPRDRGESQGLLPKCRGEERNAKMSHFRCELLCLGPAPGPPWFPLLCCFLFPVLQGMILGSARQSRA